MFRSFHLFSTFSSHRITFKHSFPHYSPLRLLPLRGFEFSKVFVALAAIFLFAKTVEVRYLPKVFHISSSPPLCNSVLLLILTFFTHLLNINSSSVLLTFAIDSDPLPKVFSRFILSSPSSIPPRPSTTRFFTRLSTLQTTIDEFANRCSDICSSSQDSLLIIETSRACTGSWPPLSKFQRSTLSKLSRISSKNVPMLTEY